MKNFLVLAVLAAFAWFGYGKYQAAHSAVASPEAIASRVSAPLADDTEAATSIFTCDGRTMCSQMTSCAEATYFIKHCPNTKMDGNDDGVPCERQWCN